MLRLEAALRAESASVRLSVLFLLAARILGGPVAAADPALETVWVDAEADTAAFATARHNGTREGEGDDDRRRPPLGVVTWATSEYVSAYGAIIESNRRWCERAGLLYHLDATDYTSQLPPPRVMTWGKVLALKYALTK